ncbi:MAG: ABC transporter ATP-binding protein [Spirochaetia bacterium]|nr:ABC transporter ATP-binding protein [Spirochaetia bacterium]
MSIVFEAKDIVKTYKNDELEVDVLKGINLNITKGDFVSIRGSSGVGKSTFLNILGALDKATSGTVKIDGVLLDNYYKNDSIHLYRREKIGFVFQSHYLMPDFTVLENVMMPLLILKENKKIAEEKAKEALKDVGLENRIAHFPSQISGGESQRAAAARAIVHTPPIILADEPTGNLDNKNSERFIEIFSKLQEQRNLTILVVTHDLNLADMANKKYKMDDGLLYDF